MNSIGGKIQAALMGSIIIIVVCAVAMLTINQLGAFRNQRLIDTMTMEYSILSLSDKLILSYNSLTKNPSNTQANKEYQTLRTQLQDIIASLRERITFEESKLLLVGVESTVNKVISECDKGINEMRANQFESVSDHYAQAHKDNEFVRENTRTLLQKELEYLYQTQQETQRAYITSLVVTATMFFLVFFGLLIFARSFTKQLVTPLVQLSVFAKEIAAGNLTVSEKQTWSVNNDEIGSLTTSIRTMVSTLIGTLTEKERVNIELQKATETMKKTNTELQAMNNLMIGRELKMIELKKELSELRKVFHSPPPSAS